MKNVCCQDKRLAICILGACAIVECLLLCSTSLHLFIFFFFDLRIVWVKGDGMCYTLEVGDLGTIFMSHGDIVNIRLSVLIIFPQTEQLVILAVFNLLELTGGADIAEYECRRKQFGLTLPNELVRKSSIVRP